MEEHTAASPLLSGVPQCRGNLLASAVDGALIGISISISVVPSRSRLLSAPLLFWLLLSSPQPFYLLLCSLFQSSVPVVCRFVFSALSIYCFFNSAVDWQLCSLLFCSALLCSVQLCSALLCSTRFYCALLHSFLLCYIQLDSALLCSCT